MASITNEQFVFNMCQYKYYSIGDKCQQKAKKYISSKEAALSSSPRLDASANYPTLVESHRIIFYGGIIVKSCLNQKFKQRYLF